MLKKITAAAASALMLLSCSCAEKSQSSLPETDQGSLTVDILDVGKADSMILTTENSTVIIDCGEKGDGKEIVNLLEEKNITDVDYLIITHYDKDHVGGAAKVINNLNVHNVLAPDYSKESEEMDKYYKALEAKSIEPQLLTQNLSFTLDSVDFTVYAPEKTFYGEDDENDFSLVTKAVHGNNTLLFTGDAMEQRLDEIMDIGKCTFLKVPYHGRKLENLEEFLKNTSPEFAAVCTSKSEFASSTQTALTNLGITYYSTCFNGKITVVSNGSSIAVNTEK